MRLTRDPTRLRNPRSPALGQTSPVCIPCGKHKLLDAALFIARSLRRVYACLARFSRLPRKREKEANLEAARGDVGELW